MDDSQIQKSPVEPVDNQANLAIIVVAELIRPAGANESQPWQVEWDLERMLALCVDSSGHPVREGLKLQVIFPTADQALSWALAIQTYPTKTGLDQRLEKRIGIHRGEVQIGGKALHGEGLDIANFLQSKATAGVILVSQAVVDVVSNPASYNFVLSPDWEEPVYLLRAAAAIKKLAGERGDQSLWWWGLAVFVAISIFVLILVNRYLYATWSNTHQVPFPLPHAH